MANSVFGKDNNADQNDEEEQESASPPVQTSTLDPLAGPNGSDKSRRLASYWKDQLDEVTEEYKKWVKRGQAIEARYRDERKRTDESDGQRRFNSLWCNVETLYPAIYGRTPLPVAERRFRDKDPIGRGAAQILERGLRNEIEINNYDDSVGSAVKDYLLPGRGVCWVRYEPEFEEGVSIPVENGMDISDARGDILKPDESPEEEKFQETGDRIVRESTPVDYINWTDFFTFPAKARKWKEVVAIAKRVYLTRDQLIKRFSKEIGKAIPVQREAPERRRQNDGVAAEDKADMKSEVFEIWSRTDESVYWIAEGYDFLCDRRDDPLELDDFFPVPKPLYANTTNSTLVPTPDYMEYQDQAIQIDELTARIALLARACKVTGTYDASQKNLQRLLEESVENELIPVDQWAAFAEKGGIPGSVSFMPLKDIIGVINELTSVKEKQIAEMDRLTGITDVMRGVTSDGRETMGGVRMRSNNGATRLKQRQGEVARFCRDIIRLMAEIMAKHFSPQSLIECSGALYEEGLGAVDAATAAGMMQQTGMLPPQAPPPAPPPAPVGQLPPPGMPAGAGGGVMAQPGGGSPILPVAAPGAPGLPSLGPGAPVIHPGLPPGGTPPGAGAPPVGAPTGLSGGAPPLMPPRPMTPPGPPMGLGGAPGIGGPQSGPGNVVPFPGGPMAALTGRMQGSLPPEFLEKLMGLKRIADSISLIRNEKLRGFRVDIEVDSTVVGDDQQEKQDRTEFIGTTTKFLETSLQMGNSLPEIVPLLGKFLQFGVRGFKVGRDLESAIEDFCDEMEKLAKQKQAAPPPPNPLQIKAQAEAQQSQVHLEVSKMKMATEQQKAQAEVQRQQVENAGEQANAQLDLQSKQQDSEMMQMQMQIERIKLQIELAKLNQQHAEITRGVHESMTKSAGPDHKVSESISFKDLPPEGKVQMAAQAGIAIATPEPEPVVQPGATAPQAGSV